MQQESYCEVEFQNYLNGFSMGEAKKDMYLLKFESIIKLIKKEITNTEAAEELNYSVGHIKKIKRNFKREGYSSLIHKLQNSKKESKFSEDMIAMIISLFNGEYSAIMDDDFYDHSGSSIAEFHRHLTKENGDLREFDFNISYSSLYNMIKSKGLVSVYSKAKKTTSDHSGRKSQIQYSPGQRWEADGTFDDWYGDGVIRCAHIIYDRGLKAPVAVYITDQETTEGYMHALYLAISKFGIPDTFISDKRSTFWNVSNTSKDGNSYDTRFNNLLDELGIAYSYSSNPNAKPAIEGFNADFKRNMPNYIKRHEITDCDTLNDKMTDYVEFCQKIKMSECQKYFKKQITKEEYKSIAIISRRTLTVQKKGRFVSKLKEYEIFKDGTLRKLAKGSKIMFVTNIFDESWIIYKKVPYEIRESITVDKSEYEKIKVENFTRKIKNASYIIYNCEKYVIIRNDNSFLDLEPGTAVLLEVSATEMKVKYDDKWYAIIKLEDYIHKNKIREKIKVQIKYGCIVKYEDKEWILTNEQRELILVASDSKFANIKFDLKKNDLVALVENVECKMTLKKDLSKNGRSVPKSNPAYLNLLNG